MVKTLDLHKKPDRLRRFYHRLIIPQYRAALSRNSRLVIIGAGGEWDYREDFKHCRVLTTEIDRHIPADRYDDICHSTLPNAFADGVIFMGMWETVDNPFLAFWHVQRILKVGGQLLLGVPFNGNTWSLDFWRITPKGLRKLLFDHYDFSTNKFYNFQDNYLFTIARKESARVDETALLPS